MTDEAGERRRAGDIGLENLRRETDYRFEAIAQRFAAQEAAVGMALAAAKEAVVLANLANEKRFDQLSEKIDLLTTSMNTVAGRSTGVSSAMAGMVAAATLAVSLVVFLVNGR